MRDFFAKQKTDEIGQLAVKVEVTATFAMILYIIYICLAFVLSSIYNTSMVGVIFSFLGLLVAVGFIGAARQLMLALVGSVIWLMTVVIMYSAAQSAPHAIDATTIYTPAALALAIALCILNPVLVLLNIYSLSLAARLKNLLCAEKLAKLEILEQVKVREMVHTLLQQELQTMKTSKRSARRHKSSKGMPLGSASNSPMLLSTSPPVAYNMRPGTPLQ